MKPLTKSLILVVVVMFYSLLYMATSIDDKCDDLCQKISRLNTTLFKFDYFYGANRCASSWASDTLCVRVKDTIGINWDRFADTVCLYANSVGLYQQKIFLIRNSTTSPPDTVARKQCP